MMKIKTKINVNYNTSRVTGNTDGIVEMIITGGNQVLSADESQTMDVTYSYVEEDGTLIEHSNFPIPNRATIDAMYEAVKDILPAFTTKSQRFIDEIVAGAMLEMAGRFEINISDIEIVTD